MSYNKYNTRHSGRFNTPGQFVSAGELVPGVGPGGAATQRRDKYVAPGQQQLQQQQQQQQPQQPPLFCNPPAPAPPPPAPIRKPNTQQNLQTIQTQDVEMKTEASAGNADGSTGAGAGRPHWMKTKLQGVRKVSNKERRRRQNENLRRLLTPKNALMVLNEMLPNEQLANQFKVEPANPYYNKQQSFCADLTLTGIGNYKGYGENKLTARNAAAEQAIRDLIIRKMNKVLAADSSTASVTSDDGPANDEEALPMIQLASFALHKLFSEWEYEGHKVPQLRPTSNSMSDSGNVEMAIDGPKNTPAPAPKPKPPKTAKDLPVNAACMHPCMLLTYMRPHLEYRELAVDGDKPQNMMFTMGVDVDGATYVGKASNKKEARKLAAKAACTALFNVQFTDNPSSNTPIVVKNE